MADRIVVLNGGVLEQFGTPMDLYHNPRTRFVAGFIGQPGMNFIPARLGAIDANGVQLDITDHPGLVASVAGDGHQPGAAVEIGIRPDDFALTEAANGFAVRVRVIERLGSTTIVYGNLADGTPICAALDGLARIDAGQSIRLGVDPDAIHVFDAAGRALPRRAAPVL